MEDELALYYICLDEGHTGDELIVWASSASEAVYLFVKYRITDNGIESDESRTPNFWLGQIAIVYRLPKQVTGMSRVLHWHNDIQRKDYRKPKFLEVQEEE
jgi:hypothetical protein